MTKGDKEGEEKDTLTLTLTDDTISTQHRKSIIGAERGKLIPTDVGTVVNDFLMQYFPEIMDYNFTAEVEKRFDDIAEGKTEWRAMMKDFYDDFEPEVEKTMNAKAEHKVGERILGTDPASGRPVSVKIGRFGPVVQIGTVDDKEKPRFAQMKKDQSLETITLEEAIDLFKLPREIGTYENKTVTIGTGRFGPYVLHDKKYVSLPKGSDPMAVTLEEAIALINDKRQAEVERHLRQFEEEPELEVLKGRFGPYIAYKGTNYKLPKALADRAAELTLEECMAVVKDQEGKPKAVRKRTYGTRK